MLNSPPTSLLILALLCVKPFHLFSSINISYKSFALQLNLSVILILFTPFFSFFFVDVEVSFFGAAVVGGDGDGAGAGRAGDGDGDGAGFFSNSSLTGPPLAMLCTQTLTFSKINGFPLESIASLILFPTGPSSLTVILSSGSSSAFSSDM
ncbi:hypothetical protein V8G54_020323 [Vigna mungo]|uniref:Uncharacterized protein n=1 Tax=Vigna mungo TaxID=3915 RepID=A0AAQ3RUL4_VIGMU